MLTWTPRRRNRAALVLALIVLVAALLWVAHRALFPFLVALVLAYLMLPAVNRLDLWLQRPIRNPRVARPIAIVVVYLLALGCIALFLGTVLPIAGSQFNLLWENRESLLAQGEVLAKSSLDWYQQNVPPEIQAQVDQSLRQAGAAVASGVQAGLVQTLGIVSSTVSFLLGTVVVPFWLFYVLNDETRVARAVMGSVPARFRADFRNALRIVDRILSAYIRGQLLLCLFLGVMATIGLTILGVQFPVVWGLIAGILEVLPFIGPILGLIPAVIVATIQQPILGLWTLLLFIGIQQVENLFLVPRISGKAVELHPTLILVVLVVGNEAAGLVGMLVAVPLAAIVRDLFRYLYLRFQEEPVEPREALARISRS